jgi:hypothetical protein
MTAQRTPLLIAAHDPVIAQCMGLILARLRAFARPGCLLTVAQAAAVLDCDPGAVRAWVSRGNLAYVIHPYLLRDDVEMFRDRVPSRKGLNLRRAADRPKP